MASRQNGELMQLNSLRARRTGKMSGMRGNFTLPELEDKLEKLVEGALFAISARDYERLFGANDAAVGRLRHFARAHTCVTSHADHEIVFRKEFAIRP